MTDGSLIYVRRSHYESKTLPQSERQVKTMSFTRTSFKASSNNEPPLMEATSDQDLQHSTFQMTALSTKLGK